MTKTNYYTWSIRNYTPDKAYLGGGTVAGCATSRKQAIRRIQQHLVGYMPKTSEEKTVCIVRTPTGKITFNETHSVTPEALNEEKTHN